METVKIILDTDMGGDCDDAGALAMLHALADRQECEILAVTHCCRGRQYGACIEAINRYYGRSGIPVGVFADDSSASCGNDVYASAIASRFPSDTEYPDSLALLRKTLASAEDESVTLAVIGSMYTMRRLLESEADDICSMNGIVGVCQGESWFFINEEGERVGENTFHGIKAFESEQPCAVALNQKWGFCDKEGNLVFECSYEDAKSFKNG